MSCVVQYVCSTCGQASPSLVAETLCTMQERATDSNNLKERQLRILPDTIFIQQHFYKKHGKKKNLYLVLISCVYSLFNFWSTLDKLVAPKFERWVLDELNESNEQTPRVRPVHNQPFQQDSRYLLLDSFSVCFGKKVEECAAEVVSVAVGIAQLVGYCIQEQISTCKTEVELEPKLS